MRGRATEIWEIQKVRTGPLSGHDGERSAGAQFLLGKALSTSGHPSTQAATRYTRGPCRHVLHAQTLGVLGAALERATLLGSPQEGRTRLLAKEADSS